MEIPTSTLQAMIIASTIGTLSAIHPPAHPAKPKGQQQVDIQSGGVSLPSHSMASCPNCGRG